MDALEQFVSDSEHSTAVLGKGQAFVLVPLDGEVSDAVKREAKEREFCFCGCLGVKDGQLVAESELGRDVAETMLCASLAFAQHVADKLKSIGDSVEWCERLYRLPDPRD